MLVNSFKSFYSLSSRFSFSIRTCVNPLLLGLTKGDLSLDNNCKEFSSLI